MGKWDARNERRKARIEAMTDEERDTYNCKTLYGVTAYEEWIRVTEELRRRIKKHG